MSGRSSAPDKDAERVSGRVGIDPEWLLGVVRSVVEQYGAESECVLVLHVEVLLCRNGHVKVQLLRYLVLRPGRPP